MKFFDQVGVGQWFRYFTGLVEVFGALLVLIPKTAQAGLLTSGGDDGVGRSDRHFSAWTAYKCNSFGHLLRNSCRDMVFAPRPRFETE